MNLSLILFAMLLINSHFSKNTLNVKKPECLKTVKKKTRPITSIVPFFPNPPFFFIFLVF